MHGDVGGKRKVPSAQGLSSRGTYYVGILWEGVEMGICIGVAGCGMIRYLGLKVSA